LIVEVPSAGTSQAYATKRPRGGRRRRSRKQSAGTTDRVEEQSNRSLGPNIRSRTIGAHRGAQESRREETLVDGINPKYDKRKDVGNRSGDNVDDFAEGVG